MSMRTTKAAGLRFGAAWDTHIRALQQERKAQGLEPLTYGQVCADALIRMADRSLADRGGTGGPAGPSMRGILFADIAALKRGVLHGDETCEIAGVGTVSVPTARALLGDAILALVIRDGLDVVNVTNLGPTFTAAQRTAIWARAGGVCEIPACTVTTGLEIDHDHEVQFGGPSDIANASLKCWKDHQDKTHHGRRLIGPPRRRAWVHVDQLPADPARQHVPLHDIEHLLPPLPTRPTGPAPPHGGSRAGPAPPPRPATHRADPASQPAHGEQLDLLTT
jgi:hypothetical protein